MTHTEILESSNFINLITRDSIDLIMRSINEGKVRAYEDLKNTILKAVFNIEFQTHGYQMALNSDDMIVYIDNRLKELGIETKEKF